MIQFTFKCKKCDNRLTFNREDSILMVLALSELEDINCENCGEEGFHNWVYVGADTDELIKTIKGEGWGK